MCGKCFEQRNPITKQECDSLEQALVKLNSAIQRGHLPLMCQNIRGLFTVCYQQSETACRKVSNFLEMMELQV